MESQHYAKNALVVWANQDREYHYPQDMNSKVKRIDVPYGHYFPTFQYKGNSRNPRRMGRYLEVSSGLDMQESRANCRKGQVDF